MSAKALEIVRAACLHAREAGLTLNRGPWFVFDADNNPTACCAIGAVLYQAETPFPADLSNPGYVQAACALLGVDVFWLQRWWLGWDRGHQVTLIHEKDGKSFETKDDISKSALALAREFKV